MRRWVVFAVILTCALLMITVSSLRSFVILTQGPPALAGEMIGHGSGHAYQQPCLGANGQIGPMSGIGRDWWSIAISGRRTLLPDGYEERLEVFDDCRRPIMPTISPHPVNADCGFVGESRGPAGVRDAAAHPDGGWVVLTAGPGKDRLLRVQPDLGDPSVLSCDFGEAMVRGDEIDNFPRIAIGGAPPAVLVTVRSPLTVNPPYEPGIAVVRMDGRLIHNIAQQARRYHGIAVAPGTNRLYLLAEDGTVWRYENFYDKTLQPVHFVTLPGSVRGRDLGYNQAWRTATPNLIAVGADGIVYSIDPQTGRVERLECSFLSNVWAVDFEQSLAAFARDETAWLDDGRITNVSAASYSGTELASESIAAVFGMCLANGTDAAMSLPLPTTLAGARVSVRDSVGVTRAAPLFFASPTQINCQIPQGTVSGEAIVTVTSSNNLVATSVVKVAAVAPGLFAANANGQGVAAAVVLRVKADGAQSFEPVARFDGTRFVPAPIDLGPPSEQVFLILFGTGFRYRSSLAGVTARIGNVGVETLFAGPQGALVGLDQCNLRLPRSLAGRGEVDVILTVDGKTTNTVGIQIR